MMLLDAVFLALSATLVPILRVRGFYGQTELKDQTLLTLSALHLAGCVLVEGTLPVISGLAGQALFAYLCILTLSCYWSDNAEDSIRDLPRWWCLFYVFLAAQRLPLDYVAEALFVPAPFVAIYGLSQQWTGRDLVWKDMDRSFKVRKKGERLYSWLGNTNYTAAYLCPQFFLGLYLMASHSLWWSVPLAPVWIALVWTHCRAAALATIVGLSATLLLLYQSPVLLVVCGCLLCVVALICLGRIEPIIGRLYYVRTCLRLWRQNPLFGHGPRVFRRHYFVTQAEMNREDPTILGTVTTPGKNTFPVGKRAHSDWFETLAESGLVGWSLFALFAGSCLYGTISEPVVFGGVLAFLVNAVFFYNFRMSSTALPFMAMAGATASPDLAVPAFLWQAVVVLALAVLVYRLAWIPVCMNFLFHDGQYEQDKAKRETMLFKALSLDPHNNMILPPASLVKAAAGRLEEALLLILTALLNNDGQKVAWTVWDHAGRVAFMNGALPLASFCFKKAIYLNPAYIPAVDGLHEVEAHLAEAVRIIEARQQQKEAA